MNPPLRASRSARLWMAGGLWVILVALATGCARERRDPAPSFSPADETAFLDTLEARTFRFFWDQSNPQTGVTPDRWPGITFDSISATGFALTACPIGVERGYVSRAAAARRVLNTLRFFWTAKMDTAATGATGYQGLYYHFLEHDTGHRFKDVELSTVDTALLLAGVLFCQSYFDGHAAAEDSIRALADSLYLRADWRWASPRPPAIGHGWDPEGGFLPYDWKGYDEAMIVYIVALGSTTHPPAPGAWDAWTSEYKWGTFEGQDYLGFAPLFGFHYSHVWVDFRGIQDDYTRGKEVDYFEIARRATLAHHAYALENPAGWDGYGAGLWGLTACDGPMDDTLTVNGRKREFHTYWARGASFRWINDDGTVAPAAAGGSIAYAPDLVIPTLMAMVRDYGPDLFTRYGFVDALNPSLKGAAPIAAGHIVPGRGWFDNDYLGIDQGPILAMVENHRTGLVWKTMRRNAHLVRGLRAAGFSGGWLDSTAVGR